MDISLKIEHFLLSIFIIFLFMQSGSQISYCFVNSWCSAAVFNEFLTLQKIISKLV